VLLGHGLTWLDGSTFTLTAQWTDTRP